MSNHASEDRLHAWVDDTLRAEDRAEVEAHLAQCVDCARDAEAIRALVGELAALPSGIPPRRDLLPEIAQRIDRAETARPPRFGAPSMRRAAAVLLVAGAAAIAGALLIDRSQPVTASADTQAFERTRAEYARATAELEGMLDAQRAALSAEAAMAVDHSLAAIDAALGEAAAALEKEPDNTLLTELVLDGWERKLDVLRRAAEPTAP